MTINDIPLIAQQCLSDWLDKPGTILYSSYETIKPGSVYLLGFNPGGTDGTPLKDSIAAILHKKTNDYLDQTGWKNGNGTWPEDKAPLQKRVCWLLEMIGLNPGGVCASNLIFLQSRKANDIDYSMYAERCWPVHEAILGIVQPKLIITFGNSKISPYSYLHSKFGSKEDHSKDDCIPSGHGNWNAKGFQCKINGNNVYVAGLPHLSRYSPKDKTQVVEWLSRQIRI